MTNVSSAVATQQYRQLWANANQGSLIRKLNEQRVHFTVQLDVGEAVRHPIDSGFVINNRRIRRVVH